MSKVTIDLEIPERIRGTELEKKLIEKAQQHALEQAVLELYKEGEISTGTGAELLKLSRWVFIKWLGQHEVSIFPSTEAEVAEEIRNVDREIEQLARPRS